MKAFWFSTSENICKILFANSNVTRTSVNVLVAALVKHWRGKTFHETVMSKIGKKNTWSRCFTTKDWTMLMGLWHLSGEWQQWQQWDYTGRHALFTQLQTWTKLKGLTLHFSSSYVAHQDLGKVCLHRTFSVTTV